MRATINFEIDAHRVLDTMRALALQESVTLHNACVSLERLDSENILEELGSALRFINAATQQLEQYHDMLLSFERARFEQRHAPEEITPPELEPPAEEGDIKQIMNQWEGFLEKINTSNARNETDNDQEG